MVMKGKLNRKMSWGALLMVVVSAVCVLPVAAQKRPDTDAGGRGVAEREPKPQTVTQAPASAAESRDLESRIERLEKLLQELNQTVKGSAANSSNAGQSNRGTISDLRAVSEIEVRNFPAAAQVAGRTAVSESIARNNRLKETLLALDKQAWDAASRRKGSAAGKGR